jgi:RNA polymerase sigma-54 factor
MALNVKLELRQSQTLVMTPQLQQAIKLLQLSNLDLTDYVEQQLENNPLLERDEGGESGEGEGEGGDDDRAPANGEAVLETLNLSAETSGQAEAALDVDYDNVFTNEAAPMPGQSMGLDANIRGSGGGSTSGFDAPEFSLENTLTAEPTLVEHLSVQIQESVADPALRLVCADMIHMVDECGRLPADLSGVVRRLNCTPEQVEQAVAALQACDPAGICARSLAECLAIQLREKDRFDPAMKALVDHLDLVGKGQIDELRKICGVDAEDVADMISEITQLDPKPGMAFSTEVAQSVVPDVFVRPDNAGGWQVELNSDTLPKVLVNTHYYATVSQGSRTEKDKTYINECLNTANWLVKSLNQRANTILKVSTEIVRQQDGFLSQGIEHLRPLNLRTIAEAIEMHESTVSRVTANKYMATPRGIFELKYFFTTAISSAEGGEAHSAESVRHRIKSLIDGEEPNAILSDDRIVELLRNSGVDIARRTVAKYREAMRIPSSVQRRRAAKMLT